MLYRPWWGLVILATLLVGCSSPALSIDGHQRATEATVIDSDLYFITGPKHKPLLVKADGATGEVAWEAPLGTGARSMRAVEDALLVSVENEKTSTLVKFDLRDGSQIGSVEMTARTVFSGRQDTAILTEVTTDSEAWLVSPIQKIISIVDLDTMQLVETLNYSADYESNEPAAFYYGQLSSAGYLVDGHAYFLDTRESESSVSKNFHQRSTSGRARFF